MFINVYFPADPSLQEAEDMHKKAIEIKERILGNEVC